MASVFEEMGKDSPDNEGFVVAFECPDDLVGHPDVRIVTKKYNGKDVPHYVYLAGCKGCQQLRQDCKCAQSTPSEKLVYERDRGLHGILYAHVNQEWAKRFGVEIKKIPTGA